MRTIVTGATGFVGRAVLRRLSGEATEVVCLVRAISQDIDARQVAIGDVGRFDAWRDALAGATAVIYLAAIAHRRAPQAHRLEDVNVRAVERAARAAGDLGARFVFVSSVKVHGEESGARAFDAGTRFAPEDAYGRSKVEAERALAAIRGLRHTVIRPPLVYGPGVKANFLALMRAVERAGPCRWRGYGTRAA